MSEKDFMDVSTNKEEKLHRDIKRIEARFETMEDQIEEVHDQLKAIKALDSFRNWILVILLVAFVLNFFGIISIQGKKATLIVEFTSSEKNEQISDVLQVENALKKGGSIIVLNTNDGYDKAFGTNYYKYGARNKENYFFTQGAVINYISSQGWTLVESPTLGNTYYFVR